MNTIRFSINLLQLLVNTNFIQSGLYCRVEVSCVVPAAIDNYARKVLPCITWLNIDSKTIEMKTVPYLHPDKEENATISNKSRENDLNIPKEMNGHKPEFMHLFNQNSPFRFMKVHTDLMEEMGIKINDIAVIDPEVIPVTGKIVVVKVDKTLMIRRFEKIKHGYLLHDGAQKISPLKIDSGHNQVNIIGVVTFIIKSL